MSEYQLERIVPITSKDSMMCAFAELRADVEEQQPNPSTRTVMADVGAFLGLQR